MGKYLTELIIEGKPSVMDNLPEPYIFLVDKELKRLQEAVNILATEKGYRVINQSVTPVQYVYVLMEKKSSSKNKNNIIKKAFEVNELTEEEVKAWTDESNQGELIGRRE
jgi:hypothetical protein